MTFDVADHPMSAKAVGVVLIVVSPTIHNIKVTKTLIDGGGGLNIISSKVFNLMQIPYEHLMPTRPFSGVTSGTTTPIGKVALLVTFGTWKNYRTESVVFDVAPISLEYNAILGYPALAQFIAVAHHAYNAVKMPGPKGVITIHVYQEDAVRCIEHFYKAAASAAPDAQDLPSTSEAPPPCRERLMTEEKTSTKKIALNEEKGTSVLIGGRLTDK